MSTQIEAELAIERLLDHLRGWLVQQPEWPILMGATNRHTRKEVAKLIARELTTIPAQRFEPGQPNRDQRRVIMRALERYDREWYKGLDL